ncbi:hypothetical protein JCM11641_006329 [Rhodosporidiobolus odoratus]
MAGILRKPESHALHPSRAAPPLASPSSGSPDEDDFEADSEEDEWEAERGGPSQSGAYEQDDDEMMAEDGENEDEEREGVAAYESDQGEMYEDEDEEVRFHCSELAQIPFGMVLKAQKQLSKGKQQGKGKGKAAGAAEEEEGERVRGKGKAGKGKGRQDVSTRTNKHAPTEVSAKKPVSRARQIVEVHKPQVRDPRFDSLSGSVRTDLFKNSYGFLADQQRAELETLRKTYAQAKKKRNVPAEAMEELEESLKRMENRDVTRRNKEREQEALSKWKKQEKEKQKEGKRAFHLKDSAKKELFAKAKYEELSQDKRKLHKAMDKKRRKIGQKEKKLMPNARPGARG